MQLLVLLDDGGQIFVFLHKIPVKIVVVYHVGIHEFLVDFIVMVRDEF